MEENKMHLISKIFNNETINNNDHQILNVMYNVPISF